MASGVSLNSINLDGITFRNDIKRVVDKEGNVPTTTKEDMILPRFSVSSPYGELPTIEEGQSNKAVDNAYSDGSQAPTTSIGFGKDSYKTLIYWNQTRVGAVQSGMMKKEYNFNMDQKASEVALSTLVTTRKVRVGTALFDAFTGKGVDYTKVPSTKYDAADGLAALKSDIDTAYEKMKARKGISRRVLRLALTSDTMNNLIEQMAALDIFKYTSRYVDSTVEAQTQALARYLRIGGITLLDGMFSDASFEASNPNFTNIYSDSSLLLYVPSGKNLLGTQGIGSQPIYTLFSNTYKLDTFDVKKEAARYARAWEAHGTKINIDYGYVFTNAMT